MFQKCAIWIYLYAELLYVKLNTRASRWFFLWHLPIESISTFLFSISFNEFFTSLYVIFTSILPCLQCISKHYMSYPRCTKCIRAGWHLKQLQMKEKTRNCRRQKVYLKSLHISNTFWCTTILNVVANEHEFEYC